MVCSPGTDVFVMLLAYSFSFQFQVLFDTGTCNNRRLLNIKDIPVAIGSSVCRALPALRCMHLLVAIRLAALCVVTR